MYSFEEDNWCWNRISTDLSLDANIFTRTSFLQFDSTSYIYPSTLPVSFNKDLKVIWRDLTMIYSKQLVWNTSKELVKSNLW